MKENGVEHRRGSVAAGIEDFCETFERTVKPVVVSILPTYFAVSAVTYSPGCEIVLLGIV